MEPRYLVSLEFHLKKKTNERSSISRDRESRCITPFSKMAAAGTGRRETSLPHPLRWTWSRIDLLLFAKRCSVAALERQSTQLFRKTAVMSSELIVLFVCHRISYCLSLSHFLRRMSVCECVCVWKDEKADPHHQRDDNNERVQQWMLAISSTTVHSILLWQFFFFGGGGSFSFWSHCFLSHWITC